MPMKPRLIRLLGGVSADQMRPGRRKGAAPASAAALRKLRRLYGGVIFILFFSSRAKGYFRRVVSVAIAGKRSTTMALRKESAQEMHWIFSCVSPPRRSEHPGSRAGVPVDEVCHYRFPGASRGSASPTEFVV